MSAWDWRLILFTAVFSVLFILGNRQVYHRWVVYPMVVCVITIVAGLITQSVPWAFCIYGVSMFVGFIVSIAWNNYELEDTNEKEEARK